MIYIYDIYIYIIIYIYITYDTPSQSRLVAARDGHRLTAAAQAAAAARVGLGVHVLLVDTPRCPRKGRADSLVKKIEVGRVLLEE